MPIPLLIPLAAAGGLIAFALHKDAAAPSPVQPQTQPQIAGGRVSALATFSAFVKQGLVVPPRVLELAAAEAAQLGDPQLAARIAGFYAPAVAPQPPQVAQPAQVGGSVPAQASPTDAQAAQGASPVVAAVRVPLMSPIPGVTDTAWDSFASLLVRGEPDYSDGKRIGRYHASKTRLEQIGIDPATVVGSADAQDVALAADLADAHTHLREAGALSEHVGAIIKIPEVASPVAVTLSGLLGVVSVAGLEGSIGWLTSLEDRQRFPFTTNLFLRTNGAF